MISKLLLVGVLWQTRKYITSTMTKKLKGAVLYSTQVLISKKKQIQSSSEQSLSEVCKVKHYVDRLLSLQNDKA